MYKYVVLNGLNLKAVVILSNFYPTAIENLIH